jgi:two-component system, cell cycle response regulator DivK
MARVLIIEDNPANMLLMAYLLKAFGHETLEASSGAVGLELAQTATPQIILCDLQMPGIDGYEIAQRLKSDASLKTIPLIAVTAYAMVGDREKALAAGFDGYISKPISPESFVDEVEVFLRSASGAA